MMIIVMESVIMIMEKLNTLTLMLLDRVMLRCRSECWLHQASLVNNNQQVEEEDQEVDQVQEDLDQVLEDLDQELTTTGEIQVRIDTLKFCESAFKENSYFTSLLSGGKAQERDQYQGGKGQGWQNSLRGSGGSVEAPRRPMKRQESWRGASNNNHLNNYHSQDCEEHQSRRR